jgi:glucose/mannose-6-phosphate isomerase
MFAITEAFPEQVEQAFAECSHISGLPRREDIQNVVVLGMGGSGIAGDVLQAVASPMLPVPVTVVKGYSCPHFVDETSLVFAVSFSGNTEETVEAATDAALSGAKMVVVAGGGELARLAEAWGAPLVGVPDLPFPRAALGALAVPLLTALWRTGLLPGADQWVERAVEQLQRRRDELATEGDSSAAAELARTIGSTVPVIHGSGPLGATAALRWKSQVNENAERLAFHSSQPELCHNEICGWAASSKQVAEQLTLVQLRHDNEHPQTGRRFEITADLIRPWAANVAQVRAEGEGELAQLLDLTYFGDYVSLWLAADAGIDPGPVDVLTALKAQLAGAPDGKQAR